MRAISLHQPWASAIVAGIKKIETRSWHTDYRGPLAIHAALKLVLPNDMKFLSVLEEHGLLGKSLPRGAILGWTELQDCRLMTAENINQVDPVERLLGQYEPGRYMWMLGDFHALEKPVPFRGKLGLFYWGE